jgi:hypothetical protein
VAKQYSEFAEGHFIADILTPYIAKVRQLLQLGNKQINSSIRAEIQIFLGSALSTYGEQIGTNEPLLEAIALYRQVLKEYTRDKVPLR